MLRPLEQLGRRADLHDLALVHDDDLVGEGQRLGLVVGDVDHGVAEAAVQLLQLRAQHPFHVRVDDRQRLVEQDGVDVGAHQAAAERDLLLLVGGQPARPLARAVGQADHVEDLAHLAVDLGLRHAAVAQREGQIVVDGHGVVDHRELEHLGDVALLRRQLGDVAAVEQQLALRQGWSSPEMMLSSVVLPQPDGPSSA